MVQIDVNLLQNAPGAATTGTIDALPDLTSAHTNDTVLWVFHSYDPNIQSVEVVFDNPAESYFFPRKGKGAPAASVRTDLVAGTATIYGRAPDLGGPGTQQAKYTINAYKTSTDIKAAYSNDPTVITEQP